MASRVVHAAGAFDGLQRDLVQVLSDSRRTVGLDVELRVGGDADWYDQSAATDGLRGASARVGPPCRSEVVVASTEKRNAAVAALLFPTTQCKRPRWWAKEPRCFPAKMACLSATGSAGAKWRTAAATGRRLPRMPRAVRPLRAVHRRRQRHRPCRTLRRRDPRRRAAGDDRPAWWRQGDGVGAGLLQGRSRQHQVPSHGP